MILAGASASSGRLGPGRWTLGELASGATETLTLNVTVSAAAPAGQDVIAFTMGVQTLNEDDVDASNDSETEYTSIVSTVVAASTVRAEPEALFVSGMEEPLPEAVAPEVALPSEYVLSSAYPNPFNPETTIPFGLPEASWVDLSVYDVLGRRVAVLVEGERPAGRHVVQFRGESLSSGVYLVRMQAGAFSQVRYLTLVK